MNSAIINIESFKTTNNPLAQTARLPPSCTKSCNARITAEKFNLIESIDLNLESHLVFAHIFNVDFVSNLKKIWIRLYEIYMAILNSFT